MLTLWVCNTLPSSLCHPHLKRRAVLREQPQSCIGCRWGHCARVILQPLHPRHRLPALLCLPETDLVPNYFAAAAVLQCHHHSLSFMAQKDLSFWAVIWADHLVHHTTQQSCSAESEGPRRSYTSWNAAKHMTDYTMCVCVTPAYTIHPPRQILLHCRNFIMDLY